MSHRTCNTQSFLPLAACIAAAACVLVLGFAACSPRDIPSSAPKPVVRAWVQVSGESMLPTFPAACFVEAEFGVDFNTLAVGQTVLLWDYTRLKPLFIHHRIVAKQGDAYITQGDNPKTNPVADRPWLTRDNFVARTTGRWTKTITAP